MGGLLVFLVCWRRDRYIGSDQKGDTLLYTMIHYDTLWYTMIHYDTLWYTTSQKPLLDLKNLQFFLEDRDYSKINLNDLKMSLDPLSTFRSTF